MNAKLPFLFVCALGLAACGGAAEEGATEPASAEPASAEPAAAEPEAAAEHDAEHGAHGAEEGEDHDHAFPGEMKAFHDMLAPLWHAEPGEERAKNTCEALGDLTAAAGEVKSDVPEGVEAEAWTDGADGLAAALEELQAACPAEDLDAFQEKFSAVHDAFHVLVELVDEHG